MFTCFILQARLPLAQDNKPKNYLVTRHENKPKRTVTYQAGCQQQTTVSLHCFSLTMCFTTPFLSTLHCYPIPSRISQLKQGHSCFCCLSQLRWKMCVCVWGGGLHIDMPPQHSSCRNWNSRALERMLLEVVDLNSENQGKFLEHMFRIWNGTFQGQKWACTSLCI